MVNQKFQLPQTLAYVKLFIYFGQKSIFIETNTALVYYK